MKSLNHYFETYLIALLRIFAYLVAQHLNVSFKSLNKMHHKDEFYRTTLGYNADGHIRIRLRRLKTNHYYSLPYLLTTVAHEVVHEAHNRHSKRFYKLYRQCLKSVRKELKEKYNYLV